MTAAIGEDIGLHPAVRNVKVQLTGHPDQPALSLRVTADPDADLLGLRRRITRQALPHARTALDSPLPTTLQLAVAPRVRPKQNTIT